MLKKDKWEAAKNDKALPREECPLPRGWQWDGDWTVAPPMYDAEEASGDLTFEEIWEIKVRLLVVVAHAQRTKSSMYISASVGCVVDHVARHVISPIETPYVTHMYIS